MLGNYEILAPLGAGGMGEVYRARDTRLEREVALKVLPLESLHDHVARARLLREARLAATLNHPNICTMHEVGEADGQVYIAMELIDGQPLNERIAQEGGGLAIENVVGYGAQIAAALAHAHERHVIHRDLKSSNVVVTSDGRMKVLDFGLARRLLDGPDSANATPSMALTQTGAIVGTPHYLAPEVLRGRNADERSDLWALGVLLHELASGTLPFKGTTSFELGSSILHDMPTHLSERVPAGLRGVVRKCLAKEPGERYQRASEVGAVLEALSSDSAGRRFDEVTASPMATMGSTNPGQGARKRLIVISTTVAAASILAIVVFSAKKFDPSHGPAPPKTSAGVGADRSVAVLEFENLTGDPSLDWMKRGVAELLSSALVQSPELDVFDAQRLGDLAATASSGSKPAPLTYTFLARHGIRRAIAGSILRSGGELRIQGRIVDTGDGHPVHSYAVESKADSGLFPLVGRLIPDLQVALEVNLTGDREAESWLREITTTSADAYRLYIRGHQSLLASHWKEAADAFEKALALDSTFIAAASEASGAYWNLGDGAKLSLARAAVRRMRSRADHRGQLRIDLMESVVGDDPQNLIRSASALVQLYPENRFYTYLLGRGYYTTQQYQRCLNTLGPLMEQRYSWSWTYVLSARSAAALGDLASARRAFELGLEVTRADPELSFAYAHFLHAQGDHDRSRAVVDQALRAPSLMESPVGEGELRLVLAKDLALRGDSVRARKELQRAVALLPQKDEAWAEADSLKRLFKLK
ncbi:MAG: protein kinase [Candidatus Eisenbacteria bacterium]